MLVKTFENIGKNISKNEFEAKQSLLYNHLAYICEGKIFLISLQYKTEISL